MVYYIRNSGVDISRVAIASMFLPSGETYGWFRKNVRRSTLRQATLNAPVRRSGNLQRSHYSRQYPTGPYKFSLEVGNTADYALHVHEGVPGTIESWSHPMVLGVQSGWGPLRRANRVRGQDAQPWMEEAMTDVLRRYGLT